MTVRRAYIVREPPSPAAPARNASSSALCARRTASTSSQSSAKVLEAPQKGLARLAGNLKQLGSGVWPVKFATS